MKSRIFFVLLVLQVSLLVAQTGTSWKKLSKFSNRVIEKGVAFASEDAGYAGLGTDNAGFHNDFWKYSPGKDAWEKEESFPAQPRIFSVSFSIGNKGYVGTGLAGTESLHQGTNDFWEYDLQKKVWSQKANLPGGSRYAAVGFSANGKGYVSLGVNQNVHYNDTWEYNPANNQWVKKADFPENGKADASVFVINNEAYVLFGQTKELFPSKKSSWKFIPGKNEWKAFADFPDAARIGAIAFAHANKGYVVGGSNGATKRFQDFWEYDADKNKWTQREDAPFGVCSYGFSFVIENYAYVCTGKTKLGSGGSEIWRYEFPQQRAPGNSLIIGGSLLLGEDRIPLAAAEMKVVNTKNEVVKSCFTNLFGSFLFTDLPENEDLILTFDVKDPSWKNEKFVVVNQKNEYVALLNKDNQFKFYLSSSGKNKIQLIRLSNKNLRMNMRGKVALDDKKQTPLKDITVSLMNDNQEVMQAGTTDENGIFVFTYLPVDSTVYLSIDEKTLASFSKGTKVLLLDEGDQVVGKTTTSHPEFELTNLPPEKNTITKIYMEDAWVPFLSNTKNMEMKVVEPIYFDVAKWDVLPEAKAVLNKAVAVLKSNPKYSIEISAHTDSRGDAKSNQELSEKRANAAKEYMVSKGVNANQITAKGYGETKPLNRCVDGVNCSEEEYAKNRRMEFIIRRNK
ncbi:MAG TPA: OmpA family protein [Bacteroidia bacterium]